ncbi:hypothetical protein PT300_01290 [Enterobacteriaceae bacterium ESL0689]|nr:hypothetical protein [Enterobacteriaceae bacterium ESL0689]
MLAKIIACQPAIPGTAQLMIRLRGDQSILPDLTFTLGNNEQNYLQPDGSWSTAQHWFKISGGYPLDKGTGFRIGAVVLDPLLANTSQVQIQVALPSGETRNTTVQLARDELLSSDAIGCTDDYGSSGELKVSEPVVPVAAEPVLPPEPVPPVEPMVTEPAPLIVETPEPVAEAEPVVEQTAPRSRKPLILVFLLLLLLLLVGGALWWFWGHHPKESIAPVVNTPPPAAETEQPVVTECSSANLDKLSEMEFVQLCVQQKMDSDKLLAIISEAKKAKKCGVAQRLYANRAQGGDSQVALAYAGEYDPKDHQPSDCFNAPDADTAAYWYETVLQFDPENQKAKQRLEELRK